MNTIKLIPKKRSILLVVLLPFGLYAQSLHITTGAHVVMTGAVNLVLRNTGFVNDGNFTAGNGTIIFTGDANSTISSIGGTAPFSFNKVTINKIAGDVFLNRDVNVTGIITMSSGNLQLNGRVLNLGATGSIAAEKDQSHITGVTGSVFASGTFFPNVTLNPGNVGAALRMSGTGANPLGSFTVERRHAVVALSGMLVNQSIQRSFTISGPRIPGLTADFSFFYLTGELASNNENELTFFTSPVAGGLLTNIGRDAFDGINNVVSKSAIDPLAHFTLGTEGGPGGPAETMRSKQAGAVTAQQAAVATAIKVFPNPVHDHFTINWFSADAKKVVIGLYDQTGRLLQQQQVLCCAGINSITWQLRKYAAGIYYLSVMGQGNKKIKIIKE
jgi:hypothetical protein